MNLSRTKNLQNKRILDGWRENNPSIKIKTFDTGEKSDLLFAFSEMVTNENHVFIARDSGIFVLDTRTLNLVSVLEIKQGSVTTVAVNKDFLVACAIHFTPHRFTFMNFKCCNF